MRYFKLIFFSIFFISIFFSKKKAFFYFLKFTNFSNHKFFFFLNCFIAIASKNSFAINIQGFFFILLIFEIQIILFLLIFFFEF
jgi:hypothetical protein